MAENKEYEANLLGAPLRDVLARVRKTGPLEVELDGKFYTITLRQDSLPIEAREFLMKGGPAS